MIASFLLRNPRILLLAIIVIMTAGAASFVLLPRLEDPVLGRRVGIVSTPCPGANAAKIESLVTIPVEAALQAVTEIKQIRSNSQSGISNVVIELQDEVTESTLVWTKIRDQLTDVQNELPDSCREPELDIVPLKAFAAIVAVKSKSGDDNNTATLRSNAQQLRRRLIAIAGTEEVTIFGDPGEEVTVKITPERMAQLGLSPGAIAQQIQNGQINRPSGRIVSGEETVLLDIKTGQLPLQRIRETLIRWGKRGESARLSEVATVSQQIMSPPNNIALIDSQQAVVLGIMADDQQRIDVWSSRFEEELRLFRNETAADVNVDILFAQRDHVEQRMQTLLRNLGFGILAVVCVVLVMMGWRSMLVVATALPLSALMVLATMRVMRIPLHQMSVTGLIVALGLLIDNAIVIVEEVRSRILAGDSRVDAIRVSVRHLAVPLLGSTITTALAFLPIATLPGPPGEFVGTIAVSVIIAICSSFLLAMSVIPAMLGLLGITSTHRGLISRGLTLKPVQRIFEFSLRVVFRIPVLGILVSIILPIAGFAVARQLPEQFFPPSDRGQIQIEVERPVRSTIDATQQAVEQIHTIVADHERVHRQHWFVGASAPTFFYNVVPRRRGTPFYAQAFVDLKSSANSGQLVSDLQSAIDAKVTSSRVIVRQLEQGPPFDAPIELRILGPNPQTLHSLGRQLRSVLAQTSHVIHTRSDVEEATPRLSLEVNAAAAAQSRLAPAQIAGLVYTMTEGVPAGTIARGDEEIPVHVRVALDDNVRLNQLAALPLPLAAPTGPPRSQAVKPPSPWLQRATLDSLTDMALTSDAGAIVRVDGRRANEVKAYIAAGVLPSVVMKEFRRNLTDSGFELPDGYDLEFGGETEQRVHAVRKLMANGIVLFSLMLLTLVASFRSFRCALIVASVGGLSIGLGPLALSIFGFPFGFMAIVGTMGLVGVAINDSIVVLAAIRENTAARTGDRPEIVKVVMGCSRHILATTLTTIAGFAPLIAAGGGFWPPLAITIAGGVGGATLLALYFVPSCYLVICGTRAKERANSSTAPTLGAP